MRKWMNLVSEAMTGQHENVERLPKPYRVVTFDEDDDMAHIYRNPPAPLLKKIIGNYDARALLDHRGDLYVWPELNCFHNDVIEGLDLDMTEPLMLTNPDRDYGHAHVGVKGVATDPEPFTDEKVLSALHQNRGLRDLYGENFPVDTFDWG